MQCTVPPLLYNSGKFSLKVRIEDGTSNILAVLSDQVIALLVGISCTVFRENLQSQEGKATNARLLKGTSDVP